MVEACTPRWELSVRLHLLLSLYESKQVEFALVIFILNIFILSFLQ